MLSFLEVSKRAELGPMIDSNDFSMEKIAKKVIELQKKYDLSYDPEVFVNTDDDLVDRVWQAGRELIIHAGLLNVNSRRIIQFSEREVDENLAALKPEFMAGEGKDAARVYRRDVEDSRQSVTSRVTWNHVVVEAAVTCGGHEQDAGLDTRVDR